MNDNANRGAAVPSKPQPTEYELVLMKARAMVTAAAAYCVRSKWLFVPDHPDNGDQWPDSYETQFLMRMCDALLDVDKRITAERERARVERLPIEKEAR